MSQQSLRQTSIRAVTGTTGTHNEDWIALFNLRGMAAGSFEARMIAYINNKLTTSYTEVNAAMAALAANASADSFQSMGTFTP
jgi:hypothetical protein